LMGPWIRDYLDSAPLAIISISGFLPLFRDLSLRRDLSAGVVLAIHDHPLLSSVCTTFFRVVPQTQREASLALGATKWEMVNTR